MVCVAACILMLVCADYQHVMCITVTLDASPQSPEQSRSFAQQGQLNSSPWLALARLVDAALGKDASIYACTPVAALWPAHRVMADSLTPYDLPWRPRKPRHRQADLWACVNPEELLGCPLRRPWRSALSVSRIPCIKVPDCDLVNMRCCCGAGEGGGGSTRLRMHGLNRRATAYRLGTSAEGAGPSGCCKGTARKPCRLARTMVRISSSWGPAFATSPLTREGTAEGIARAGSSQGCSRSCCNFCA